MAGSRCQPSRRCASMSSRYRWINWTRYWPITGPILRSSAPRSTTPARPPQSRRIRYIQTNGLGQDSDVIAGVIWAAVHDADVILMAFSNPNYSDSLQEAIDYAWSKDVLLVAAVGNDGVNAPSFPAGDRGVIGVSATDENDQLAAFSNYGASVFLAAPGTDILTTDLFGAYSTTTGTSSSAAIVAGAAAQLMTFDPMLTNGIVVGRLARNADPAGPQEQTGNGRINFARAFADTGTEFL